jgi:hypothetical protein
LTIVAEGVEKSAQLDLITRCGCEQHRVICSRVLWHTRTSRFDCRVRRNPVRRTPYALRPQTHASK